MVPENTDGQAVPFWHFSMKVAEEFPGISVGALWMHSSFNRSFLEQTHMDNFVSRNRQHSTNSTMEEWKRMLAYVESVDVQILSAGVLFEKVSVPPSSVDVLMTDAGGADYEIFSAFMAVSDFSPVVIKLESKVKEVLPKSEELMPSLHSKYGYPLAAFEPLAMLAINEG
eukprot:UN3233